MAIKSLDDPKAKRIQVVGKKVTIFAVIIVIGLLIGLFYQSKNNKKQLTEATKTFNVDEQSQKIQSATADLVKGGVQSVENNVAQVLGIATGFMQTAASQSSSLATNFIFDKTMGNILKQFNKLSETQQTEVREYICK